MRRAESLSRRLSPPGPHYRHSTLAIFLPARQSGTMSALGVRQGPMHSSRKSNSAVEAEMNARINADSANAAALSALRRCAMRRAIDQNSRHRREHKCARTALAKSADCILLVLWLAAIGAGGGDERLVNGLRLFASLVQRHSRLYSAGNSKNVSINVRNACREPGARDIDANQLTVARRG